MELTDVGNAELAALGAGSIVGSRSGNGFLSGVAKAAGGFAVGYAIGRNI